MHFTTLTADQFSTHLTTASRKSFQQSLEMAELYSKRGYQVTFLGLVDDSNQVKVSTLAYRIPMFGGYLLSIDSGPVHNDPADLTAFYQGLKAYGKEVGALIVQVKPYDIYQTFDSHGQELDQAKTELISQLTTLGYDHQGLYTGYPNGEASWNYVKDLTGLNASNLINSFSKKGRPLIKKAKSFGTQIRRLNRDELHIFKDITASTSDRRHYTDKPLEYYQDFYDSFGEQVEFMVASLNFQTYAEQLTAEKAAIQQQLADTQQQLAQYPDSAKWKTKLQEVSKQVAALDKRLEQAQDLLEKHGQEDVVLAGALFIYTKQESYYLFSGSYTEFNQFYAPALLQEHAMLRSLELGIPTYNFLGIAGLFDQTDGVLQFKQNFNGHITRHLGAFYYHPKPLTYQFIQAIKKLLRR